MKFVMLGSGAVGSYFGARLHQAGYEVVFVARGKQWQALREQGLTLRQNHEETILRPITVTDDMTVIGPADYVLISVKTWQLAAVLSKLSSLQQPHTRFLTLQNGVDAPQIVADTVGAAQTLGGLVRGFFEMDAPGIVRHVGVRPAITFGQIDGTRTAEAEQLWQCFHNAGIYSEISNNIEASLWEKFMVVTSLGGVGAVTRSTIGEIRDYEPTAQMLQSVMAEIVGVAQRRGIKLPDELVARSMAYVQTFPPEATTSMQRDLMNGQPSELEAQTGTVVRIGNTVGHPTPINQFIYNSLILQEKRAQSQQAEAAISIGHDTGTMS